MNKNLPLVLLILILTTSFATSDVQAVPTVTVSTSQSIYNYGDFLSIIIEVSEITKEIAILHITDQNGVKSSPIVYPVQEIKSTFTAPFPFEAVVFQEGLYMIDIEYDGATNSTEFTIVDAGNVVIPFWIKDLSKYWYNDTTTDKEFIGAIEYLIKENIIVVSENQSQETIETKIPRWVKTTTGWWIDGKVSDKEFILAIEYLIKLGVIIV